MSLDVTLTMVGVTIKKESSGIFIREDGEMKEISEEEWNRRNPDTEPVRFMAQEIESGEVYDANITHNLGTMAEEAGIYKHLWRPEEINIEVAKDLIEPLKEGLQKIEGDPEHYKTFNPENGWGSYEGLIRFVKNYIEACEEYPESIISISR